MTTDTFWSVDGVSLQTHAYNIQTWGGDAQSVPSLRGEDLTVPFAQGDVFMEKVPAARTISFGMWVIGAKTDGTLPTDGSSRELFERHWRAIRKLLWNPSKQITLTKRFRDWDTGEIISASAKAQFAGGLTPTMNGTQRAQFVVQLKLTDPFFYSDIEEELDVSAYDPKYTNVAKNPTPITNTSGYGAAGNGRIVKAKGIRKQTAPPPPVYIPGVGWTIPSLPATPVEAEDSNMVKVDYVTEPPSGEGGPTFGRLNVDDLPVTPGETRRFSMRVLLTNRANRMRINVKFFDAAGSPVGTTTYGPSTLVPKRPNPTVTSVTPTQWTKLKTANVVVPAGAVRAQVAVTQALDGTDWRSKRSNYALDPSFETGSALREVSRNLYRNPQWSKAPTTYSIHPMYTNKIVDPETKNFSGELEVVRNYIGNPDFETANTAGWVTVIGSGFGVFGTSPSAPQTGSYCGALVVTPESTVSARVTTSVTPAVDVVASVWLKGSESTVATLTLSEVTATEAPVGTTTTKDVNVTTAWARFDITRLNQSATTKNVFGVTVTSTPGITVWVDSAQLERGTVPTDLVHPRPSPDGLLFYKQDAATKRTVKFGTTSSTQMDSVKFVRSPRLASTSQPDRLIGRASGVGMSSYNLTTNLGIMRTGLAISAAYGAQVYRVGATEVNKNLTVTALCYIPDGYDASEDLPLGYGAVSRGIYVENQVAYGQAQAPSTPGLHVVRAVIKPQIAGELIRLGGGGLPGQQVFWGLITVVSGIYRGAPFSGNSTMIHPTATLGYQGMQAKWTGAVNNSPSAIHPHIPSRISWDTTKGAFPKRTRAWSYEDMYSLELVRIGSAANAARGVILGTFPQGNYRISAVVNIPDDYDASEDVSTGTARSRSIAIINGVNPRSLQAPSTPGTHIISDTFTVNAKDELRVTGGGLEGQSLMWGMISVVKLPSISTSNDIVKRPYTGKTVMPDLTFTWAGTANDSESIVRASISTGAADTVPSGHDNCVTSIRSTQWADTGTYSLRAITTTEWIEKTIAWLEPSWMPKLAGTYTLKAKVRVEIPGTGSSLFPRRFVANAVGVSIKSPPVPNTVGVHDVEWNFTVAKTTNWTSFGFEIGSLRAEYFIDSLLITEGTYTRDYFDGNHNGGRWLSTANLSMSVIDPDIMYANKVGAVEGASPFDYFSGREIDAAEPAPPERNSYGWMGNAYGSTSVLFEPRTVPVNLNVKGDYQTNRVIFDVETGVSGFTIENDTGDGDLSMTYGWGSVATPSQIDVSKFTAVSGAKKTSAYVDHEGSIYWFLLRPGNNALLTSGVGTGKIKLRYRSAWL